MNVDVKKTRVASHHQGLQHAVTLRWQVEILVHGFSVDHDLSASWSDINKCLSILPLAVAPCPAILVNLIRPLFLWKHPPEVE